MVGVLASRLRARGGVRPPAVAALMALLALLAAVAATVPAAAVSAQGTAGSSAAGEPGQPAAPVLTPEQQEEAVRIEGLLMCPVCRGQTVRESRSEVAEEIKLGIRRMLAEGKTRQEILDYYVGEYGPSILSQPPVRGAGAVAWLLPVLILVLGAAVLFGFFRRGEPDAGGAPDGDRGGAPGGGPGPPGRAAAPAAGASDIDPEVRRRLEERLQEYL